MSAKPVLIDNLQYANFSPKVFEQMRAGGVDAVHVTIAYHESFREMILNLEQWNRWFEVHGDLIFQRDHSEQTFVWRKRLGALQFSLVSRTLARLKMILGWWKFAINLAFVSCNSPITISRCWRLGCYEDDDTGLTRMGKQVVAEMNRVGMVIDMSHSADRSTLEAIEHSTRPIAITHANPDWWHPALRNKSDEVLRALTDKGGMLGFSIYPHHLAGGTNCTLDSFCQMIAEAASRYGAENLGIGTDLCQDQPDSIVEWMRVGRWSKTIDYGEGSASNAGFPAMPTWFNNNRDFGNIAKGLIAVGMKQNEVDGVMGNNWLRFYETSFGPGK